MTFDPGGNEAIVRAQFEAYRDRRRADSEALLAPDFTFTSPYDDAIDRDAFFRRCWPPGDQFAEFTIERVTGDADGAFVTYLVTTKAGAQFRNTEYLAVSDGQIHSADVYFGASYRGGVFVAKEPPTSPPDAMAM
jgi:ketosteroid isomerase-like protein